MRRGTGLMWMALVSQSCAFTASCIVALYAIVEVASGHVIFVGLIGFSLLGIVVSITALRAIGRALVRG